MKLLGDGGGLVEVYQEGKEVDLMVMEPSAITSISWRAGKRCTTILMSEMFSDLMAVETD